MTNRFIPDLVYATPNGSPQQLDLYLPPEAARPMPIIVWLHGGGWRRGDKNFAPDLSRYFAASGFAMASIDYRLSDEAIFPAQIHDVKAAIRWLRANAEEYNLDGERIGLWGSSAGGHLAAIAALTGDNQLDSQEQNGEQEHSGISAQVQAVVDGYGPTDFSQMDAQRKPIPAELVDHDSIRPPASARTADPGSFESLLIGAPINERSDLVQVANPVTYARTDAPPFLILHGLSDEAVPAHQSELLYDALANHDNDVTLFLLKGLGHGFLNRTDFDQTPRTATVRQKRANQPEASAEDEPLTFETIGAFFREHLC